MRHAEQALVKHHAVMKSTGKPIDFNGRWTNELGSYMDLAVTGTQVAGEYVSAVSSNGGKTRPYPLSGTIGGDLISFMVNWDGVLITAWVGHGVISNSGPQILTLWQMVMTVASETDPSTQWKTVEAGADTFTLMPTEK